MLTPKAFGNIKEHCQQNKKIPAGGAAKVQEAGEEAGRTGEEAPGQDHQEAGQGHRRMC